MRLEHTVAVEAVASLCFAGIVVGHTRQAAMDVDTESSGPAVARSLDAELVKSVESGRDIAADSAAAEGVGTTQEAVETGFVFATDIRSLGVGSVAAPSFAVVSDRNAVFVVW